MQVAKGLIEKKTKSSIVDNMGYITKLTGILVDPNTKDLITVQISLQ